VRWRRIRKGDYLFVDGDTGDRYLLLNCEICEVSAEDIKGQWWVDLDTNIIYCPRCKRKEMLL